MKKMEYFHKARLLLIVMILSGIFAMVETNSASKSFVYGQETNDKAPYSIQNVNHTEAIVLLVNLERIRTQMSLTQQSLDQNDEQGAFAHAYIPHSVIFPALKNTLITISRGNGTSSVKNIESSLADIAFMIKANNPKEMITPKIQRVSQLISNLYSELIGPVAQSNRDLYAQGAIVLLDDVNKSYNLSGLIPSSTIALQQTANDKEIRKVNYQNAIGLVDASKQDYQKITNLSSTNKNSEINLTYSELRDRIVTRSDNIEVSRLISSTQRLLETSFFNDTHKVGNNFEGINNIQNSNYFSTIDDLLRNVITEVTNGDYQKADQYAITAYLDNFEYLESPIEKHDSKLKSDIEIQMREVLRQMLAQKAPAQSITNFVNSLLHYLDKANSLLKNDTAQEASTNQLGANIVPSGSISSTNMNTISANQRKEFADIQALSKGFGVYTGERKQMGQASESSKGTVRENIDQIRMKLDDTLRLYNSHNFDESLSASRAAYLDSYENIEVPLRPINPDFTLDMEIKFAELRNLIQSHAPYETVQSMVIEIRKGLDESERLVSGTGVIAPAIAFSTSFSIVFREGLESALIIGAILTYLEASRNDRFKRHVYYGIALALAATGITWFIAEYIIAISGANRELIEAIAGISAVAVLFWVSFWVLNKVETKKWIEFVKAKVWMATTTGSVMVFIMLSFFTVYREGFETVLFYQAMLSFAKYMEFYVISGLFLGLGIIVGIVFLIRKLGKKLPLRVLFALTMGVGAYMSIAFIGNAVRSFQEVGYISTTHMIGVIPRLDINLANMTGIHPTLETAIAQILLLAVYLIGSIYILIIRPRKQRAIETARKSMADFKNQ
jgi:high-affinity iron transporter